MHDRRSPGGLFRAFRDRYVASFGGLSYDLAPGAIGVERALLENAPELEGRSVLVTDGRGPPGAFDRRPAFLVVALDRMMRNAQAVASEGGVVFSSFDLDNPRAAHLLEGLGAGDTLYLNSAVDRLRFDEAIKRPRFPAFST